MLLLLLILLEAKAQSVQIPRAIIISHLANKQKVAKSFNCLVAS